MPKIYIVTITEAAPESVRTVVDLNSTASGIISNAPVEHYRRRVEFDDINPVIQRLDQSLNVKVRKRRSDAGSSKNA